MLNWIGVGACWTSHKFLLNFKYSSYSKSLLFFNFNKTKWIHQLLNMSEPSNNTTESVVSVDQSGVLPTYLQILLQYWVVLCIMHSYCYTQQNLLCYLLEKHRIKDEKWRQILLSNKLQSVTDFNTKVIQPIDETDKILKLSTVRDFLCHFNQCHFCSISQDFIQQHYNKEHE